MLNPEQEALQKAHIDALEHRKGVDLMDVSNFAMTALTVHSLLTLAEHGLKKEFLSSETKKALISELQKSFDTAPEALTEIASRYGIDSSSARSVQAMLLEGIQSVEQNTILNQILNSQPAQYSSNLLNSIDKHFLGGMEGAITTAAIVAGLAFAFAIKHQKNEYVDEQIAQAEHTLASPRPTTQVEMVKLREELEKMNAASKTR
jgi:hypothetical protein